MLIALDWDGTYTADPILWDDFIVRAQRDRYTVMIVTMRRPEEAIAFNVPGVDVIYTSRSAKVPFCKALGLKVDIWIDDSPHWLLSDSA